MSNVRTNIGLVVACTALALAACGEKGTDKVARGKYLVTVISCGDCHTPGALIGKPNMASYLAGSDIGFFMPALGYFYGPNLTTDAETGLGKWSEDEIVTALRAGKRPDGRILAPIMPWMSLASLTDEDAHAIAAYLKSLPPISNKAPGPFGADETPTGPYETIAFPNAAPTTPQPAPAPETPPATPPQPAPQ